jgi:hemolysin activation/secretion protein
VFVELPEQAVADGIVYLQVSETKVGRVRVVGAKHYSPLDIRDNVPALKEGEVPDFAKVQGELAQLNKTPGARSCRWCAKVSAGDHGRRLAGRRPEPVERQRRPQQRLQRRHRKLRAVASLGYNNLWQLGHSINLTYFTAPRTPTTPRSGRRPTARR